MVSTIRLGRPWRFGGVGGGATARAIGLFVALLVQVGSIGAAHRLAIGCGREFWGGRMLVLRPGKGLEKAEGGKQNAESKKGEGREKPPHSVRRSQEQDAAPFDTPLSRLPSRLPLRLRLRLRASRVNEECLSRVIGEERTGKSACTTGNR